MTDGIVIPGDSGAYYTVRFDAITFVPYINEVYLSEVKEIVEFGAFVSIGPLQGLLHISQIGKDKYNYDTMTFEQVQKNIDAINKLNQIKFFGDIKKGSADDGKGQHLDGSDNLVEMGKNLDELRKKVGPGSSQYQAELAKYMKLKREKGE